MVNVPQEKQDKESGCPQKNCLAPAVTTPISHSDKRLPPGTDGTRVTGSDGISCHPPRGLTASFHSGLRFSGFQILPFLVVESLPGTLDSFPAICPIRASPVLQAFFNISEPEVEAHSPFFLGIIFPTTSCHFCKFYFLDFLFSFKTIN